MRQQNKVLGIVTHPKPHFDEFLALWFIYTFGNKFFDNIETLIEDHISGAKPAIFFHREGDLPVHIRDNKDQYIFLGICGSLGGKFTFDEHSTANSPRQVNETCATLVAKYLGIENEPSVGLFLKEVNSVDNHGNGGPFHLSSILKMAFEQNYQFSTILMMAFNQFELIYFAQKSFHSAGRDMEVAEKFEIQSGGETLKVVVAQTDNGEFAKYARSPFGGHQDIIVQKDKTGNVQVFTRRPSRQEREAGRTDICLDDLVKVIRLVEANIRGQKLCEDQELLLSEQGPAGSVWYYHKVGILNGSNTADVEPTKIPLNKMGLLVQIAIGDVFPSDRVNECSSGNCTNNSNPCPFFMFHLSRCRAIREEV